MTKNVSMDLIAAELNISKSLVSRALSDKYGVGDEMRNKIKITAVKMGYVFKNKTNNHSSKVESVTIIVERHDLLDSGFWVKIINGIEKELYKENISVFLSVIENDDDDFIPLSIKQMKTNGIMILGLIPLKYIASVSTTGLPIVLVDSIYFNLKFDHILANNYYGAYEATELILNYGHKKIGFVGSVSYSYSYSERLRGFTDCINNRENVEISLFNITNKHDDFYTPFSKDQFKKMINSELLPSALLCASDIIALQVYEILEEAGIKIPEDISIIGFDNIQKGEWVNPPLTSVNISKTAIGQGAAELLLDRINNPDKNPRLIMVGTDIVIRESLAEKSSQLNKTKKLSK